VLGSKQFDGISREQARAFQHATGPEGLAIIDGQAGTGKSFCMAAIRKAYEARGEKVIGLAPTNAVAQDMGRDGFARAATIHSELFALKNGRMQWHGRTVVMVDEAAMVGDEADGGADRPRPGRRRQTDPGRRRPAALQHRPRRDVRRPQAA
jgi:ATP-dependent exoDNAse (exonuclease V) alpha subunit